MVWVTWTGNSELLLYRQCIHNWGPFLNLYQIWRDVVKISRRVLLSKQLLQQIYPGQSLFATANRTLVDPRFKALQLPHLQRKAHTVVIWLQNFQQLAQHSDKHITGSSCSNKYWPHCAHQYPSNWRSEKWCQWNQPFLKTCTVCFNINPTTRWAIKVASLTRYLMVT